MIIDRQGVMSASQEFTAQAEAVSTNLIDFGADWAGFGIGGSIMELVVSVATAFTSGGAATLVVLVETDSDVAFGSAVALHTTAALALATVAVAGYKAVHMRLPHITERYVRCTYTVGTADMTAGAVDAWVNLENGTNILE